MADIFISHDHVGAELLHVVLTSVEFSSEIDALLVADLHPGLKVRDEAQQSVTLSAHDLQLPEYRLDLGVGRRNPVRCLLRVLLQLRLVVLDDLLLDRVLDPGTLQSVFGYQAGNLLLQVLAARCTRSELGLGKLKLLSCRPGRVLTLLKNARGFGTNSVELGHCVRTQ